MRFSPFLVLEHTPNGRIGKLKKDREDKHQRQGAKAQIREGAKAQRKTGRIYFAPLRLCAFALRFFLK
jgi:hypothetical protein